MPMSRRPPLGAHVSIAGGLDRAVARGLDLGCDALQVFVKNANQWQARPLGDEAVDAFRTALASSPIRALVAHSTYLINLAATDATNLRRSRSTLGDELDRCARLGIHQLVLHPGAHLGAGEQTGISRIAESLDEVFADRPDGPTRLLLETTAGQGTHLGYRLEQLAAIRESSANADRLGICLDTCHLFAAGYSIHRPAGYKKFFRELEQLFGPEEPCCIHLNDSLKDCGSRRDRHANLGAGKIGSDLFRRLVRDPRLRRVPMILETPAGDDKSGHASDLALLRSF
jgi:deoxyribonuclease-4